MRRIVVGTDSAGRSCVVGGSPDPRPIAAVAGGDVDVFNPQFSSIPWPSRSPRVGEVIVIDLWAVIEGNSVDPAAEKAGVAMALAAGDVRWRLCLYGPGVELPMHSTSTIDHQWVLDGEMALLLEDGDVALRAGDAVILPGVVHGWRTADRNCTRLTCMIGMS